MFVRDVFVTVGTTRFDKLIFTVTNEDTLRVLRQLGCDKLTIQIGAGAEPPKLDGINYEWYRYKPSIAADIAASDLVISHAGAGSCLEVLGAGKQLIVVVNDELMGDHQRELAERLASLKFCTATTPSELSSALSSLQKSVPYVSGNADPFIRFIDSVMGFT